MIFERHESLPIASGSVPLSGAVEACASMVGSSGLNGGIMEQASRAGMQPRPLVEPVDVAEQLHVKPPIIMESTSPAMQHAVL